MTWTYPCSGRITSPFGPRVLAGAVSNFHAGVDLGAGRGPVYAAQAGVVRTIWKTAKGAWVVDIRHPDEGGRQIRTRYVHMFRDEIVVAVGQHVGSGQRVGSSGASGTSAAHLHFEVLVDGATVDPVPYVAARGVHLGVTQASASIATAPPIAVPSTSAPTPIAPIKEIDVDLNNPTDRQALKALIAETLRENVGDLAIAQPGSWASSAAIMAGRRVHEDTKGLVKGELAQTLRENIGDVAASNPTSWWSQAWATLTSR